MAVITLLLGLALIGTSYWVAHAIINVMSRRLTEQMTDAVAQHVELLMDDPARLLRRAVDTLSRKGAPLNAPHELARALYDILDDDPAVDWLYFANPRGGIVSVGRLEHGAHVVLLTGGFRAGVIREFDMLPEGDIGRLRRESGQFDARKKEWYQRAEEARGQYWTEPYLGSAEPIMGISSARPIFDKSGHFEGVCGVDLILTRMSQFMNGLHMGKKGRAFLIDGAGYLIASSGNVAATALGAAGKEVRLAAHDAKDPVLRATAAYLQRHPDVAQSKSGIRTLSFNDETLGEMHATIKPFRLPGGSSWLVVSALPVSEYTAPLREAASFSLAVAIVIVIASLAIGFWAVGRALRPMYGLINAASLVGSGVWPSVPETDRKDEIGVLARALAGMIERVHELVGQLHEEGRARALALTAEAAAREMAERADLSKSKFLAAASHDLRQPIQALFMFTSVLASGNLAPRERAAVMQLERALESLKALLDALLDISRLDAQLISPDVRPVPIREVLDGLEPFKLQAAERQLSFHIVRSRAIVRTDPVMLGRIVRNLVVNAIRFTSEGGVLVGCRRRGDRLRLEVWDTGIGVAPDRQEEIFEEFIQLHNPSRDREKGLGLGLAIVKRLATLLDHRIGIRSTPGKGSVFSVDVPLVGMAEEPSVCAAEHQGSRLARNVGQRAPGLPLS